MTTRIAVCLQLLTHYHNKSKFLKRISTGDKTQVHHDTPERERDSMTWKHPGYHLAKKFNTTLSVRKAMASVFWY
jgi:hypothetical protein